MKASSVLDQGTPPGDRHREEQRVEARVVEAFADVTARREHEARFIRRNTSEPFQGPAPFLRPGSAAKDDDVWADGGEPGRQDIKMIASLREDNWRAPFREDAREV